MQFLLKPGFAIKRAQVASGRESPSACRTLVRMMIDGCGNSSEVRRHPRLILAFPVHMSRLTLSFGILDGFSHSLR